MTMIVLDVSGFHVFDDPKSEFHARNLWSRDGGWRPKFVVPHLDEDQLTTLQNWARERNLPLTLPPEISNRITLREARGMIILRDKSSSMLQSLALLKNGKKLKKAFKRGQDDPVIRQMSQEPPHVFQSISLNQKELDSRL